MSHLKIAEDIDETEVLIQRFAALQPAGTILLTRFYEPNGLQRVWMDEWAVCKIDDLSDEDPVLVGSDWVSPSWESGELSEDPEYLWIKLFRHDGKVQRYQEWRPVPCSEAAELLIAEYTGDDRFEYTHVEHFAQWMDVEKLIDCDTKGFKSIMAIALRAIADQIESNI